MKKPKKYIYILAEDISSNAMEKAVKRAAEKPRKKKELKYRNGAD